MNLAQKSRQTWSYANLLFGCSLFFCVPSTAGIAQGLEVVIAPQGQFSDNPELPWGMQAQDAARLLENNGGSLLVPSPSGTLIIAAEPPIMGLEHTYRSSRDQFISSFADGSFDADAYSALAEQMQLADTFRELRGTDGTIDLGAAYAADLTTSLPGSKYNPESGNFYIYGFIELSPDVFLDAIPEQFDDLSTAENLEFRDLYNRRDELTEEELQRFEYLLDKGMTIPVNRGPDTPVTPEVRPALPWPPIFPYSCPNRIPAKTLPAACEDILPIDPKSGTCSCD